MKLVVKTLVVSVYPTTKVHPPVIFLSTNGTLFEDVYHYCMSKFDEFLTPPDVLGIGESCGWELVSDTHMIFHDVGAETHYHLVDGKDILAVGP